MICLVLVLMLKQNGTDPHTHPVEYAYLFLTKDLLVTLHYLVFKLSFYLQ